MSSHNVDRVLNTFPQLQVAVISLYSGWMPFFIDSHSTWAVAAYFSADHTEEQENGFESTGLEH